MYGSTMYGQEIYYPISLYAFYHTKILSFYLLIIIQCDITIKLEKFYFGL